MVTSSQKALITTSQSFAIFQTFCDMIKSCLVTKYISSSNLSSFKYLTNIIQSAFKQFSKHICHLSSHFQSNLLSFKQLYGYFMSFTHLGICHPLTKLFQNKLCHLSNNFIYLSLIRLYIKFVEDFGYIIRSIALGSFNRKDFMICHCPVLLFLY